MFVLKTDVVLNQILMFIIVVHDIILICTCLQLIQQPSKKVSFIWKLKMYNHLPQSLKNLSHDVRWFRLALKRILLKNAFYSLEEYLMIELRFLLRCNFLIIFYPVLSSQFKYGFINCYIIMLYL